MQTELMTEPLEREGLAAQLEKLEQFWSVQVFGPVLVAIMCVVAVGYAVEHLMVYLAKLHKLWLRVAFLLCAIIIVVIFCEVSSHYVLRFFPVLHPKVIIEFLSGASDGVVQWSQPSNTTTSSDPSWFLDKLKWINSWFLMYHLRRRLQPFLDVLVVIQPPALGSVIATSGASADAKATTQPVSSVVVQQPAKKREREHQHNHQGSNGCPVCHSAVTPNNDSCNSRLAASICTRTL